MGKILCFDCERRNLEIQLLSRSDSQRKYEYQRPEGHTLPQVTVPLMQQQIIVQEQPTTTQQVVSEQDNKLDELRKKIEALKQALNK